MTDKPFSRMRQFCGYGVPAAAAARADGPCRERGQQKILAFASLPLV
jgi:hypothetical protein